MWPFSKPKPRDEFASCFANMTLVRETRWSRDYRNADGSERFMDSRFRDGTASITLDKIRRDWNHWSEHERIDFSQSYVHCQAADRADIVRFLIVNASHSVWSCTAATIAMILPSEESLPFLQQCCETCDVGSGANYFQALWLTKSPSAIKVLYTSLDRIWNAPDLMEPDRFCNFIAFDAIWCIDALLRLGEDPEVLRDRYNTLKTHPTMRERAIKWLAEYFEQDSS
jgi:hypothetical protein